MPSPTRSSPQRFPSTTAESFGLHTRVFGRGDPLVALHGFTFTGAQFAGLADLIGSTILAPDLPGHGRTTVEPVTVDRTVEVVAELLAELHPSPPLLGYSQGARLALLTTLEYPEWVSSLILLSGSVGLASERARRERRAADAELADHIESTPLDEFLSEWTSTGITSVAHLSLTEADADRATREENNPAGLASALRGLGQGVFPFLGDRLGELTMPVLAIAGADDEKYAAAALAIELSTAQARAVVVPRAGHNVLADALPEIAATIVSFLDARPRRE